MKRVVIATGSFHDAKDGMCRFLYSVLPYLLERYKISLFMSGSTDGLQIKNGHPNLTLFKLPYYPISFSGNYMVRFCKEARKYLWDGDLYFIQNTECFAPLSIAKKRNKPIVRYFHCFDWEQLQYMLGFKAAALAKPITLITKAIALNWYRCCSHIFLPSKGMSDSLARLNLSVPSSVLPMGLDKKYFRPAIDKKQAKIDLDISPDQVVIGYVGRFSHEKNLLLLLDTFAQFSDPNLLLLCVGGGSQRLTKKLRSHPKVKLVPPQNSILPYFHAMDIFCMPSFSETSSLATIEAMSSGLAVVASRVGCIPEYVFHKKNGLLFNPNSQSELAACLMSYIKDANFRNKMGEEAHKTISSRFDWKATADGLISVFDKLIG